MNLAGYSVLLDAEELEQWLSTVERSLGDPSARTCLLFVRWEATGRTSGEVEGSWDAANRAVRLMVDQAELLLPVDPEGPVVSAEGLKAYGLRGVAGGLWAMTPSVNLPGMFHGYVVLYGVPSPAPWERTILLPGDREFAAVMR